MAAQHKKPIVYHDLHNLQNQISLFLQNKNYA